MGHLVVGVHVEMVIVDAHGGARLVHEVDHALGHAVELFGLDAAVTCGVDDLVVRVARRHFKVEAGVEGGDAVVVGAPIAHDDAFIPPFVAEHVGEQPAVLCGMHAVDAVVGAHDGPWLGGFDDVLEGREVDLAQRPLGDVGGYAQTVGLLVVGGEVLERGAHALGLHAGDDADCLMAGQIRVFGPIFEAAAAERIALDVDSGTEDDGHLLLDAFLRHGLADLVDEFRVPGAGQAGRRREAGGGHGVVQVGFAGAGCQGFAQSVRTVGDHVAGNAFGFHTLQMPGVAAGGEGRLLFEGQVVDGRISGVAHELPLSYVFCVSGAFRLFSRPSRDCFAAGLQPRIPYLPIGRYFIKKQSSTR